MKRSLTYFLLAVIWLISTFGIAQTNPPEKILRAAEVIGFSDRLSSLPPDTTIVVTTKDGQQVCVRTGHTSTVEHIGIPLFPDEIRILQPSPVYDFLEYAVLNKKYKVQPNQLYLSKVIFKNSSWERLATEGLNSCECSISNEDDRYYVVCWKRNGRDVATVAIPIDYELLSNDTRRNMERQFIRSLTTHQQITKSISSDTVNLSNLQIYGTSGLFVRQGKCHTLVELNQNVYYQLTTNYDAIAVGEIRPVVVYDEEHPAETFANLMMAGSKYVPDVLLHLDFHLSDYHHQRTNVPLTQFTDYLAKQGCDIYFAYSGKSETELRGVLFVNNASQGYNHLLSLRMPFNQITAVHPEVQANVYLYIPSIDKSHLYGKVPDKKSGAIAPH